MMKKFIPLDDEVGPSHTPYTIRTYKGPAYEEPQRGVNIDPCCYQTTKPCKFGKLPTKSVTTEELIFRLFEIPLKPRPQKECKKKCKALTPYNTCVMDQRSPEILKHHAVVREKYLKTKAEHEVKLHDASEPSSEETSLIQLESPVKLGKGKVKPKAASPSCSFDTFYVPSRKLLDLKRQKSGIIVNETPRPVDSEIPFETYNPRILQEQIESENRKKYTLLSDGDKLYYPHIPGAGDVGAFENYYKRDENAILQDCIDFKPVIFPIPNDLNKTFTAVVVFSNGALTPHVGDIGPQRPAEIGCIYTAYVESFDRNPDYWTAKTMDSILEYGVQLCHKSYLNKYEDTKADYDIIPEITEKEAVISMKLHLTGSLLDEPNILKALSLFFNKFNACVLCSESLYLLIWKRCTNSFYIFDPNGRDIECRRNFKQGKASLMAVTTVEHIVHLILNYSNIRDRSEFNLYEIHLKDYGKLTKPMQFNDGEDPKKLFAVVNRFYAIIPAIHGLSHISASNAEDDNASMMISFLAIVYSQIYPPKHWNMVMVNDLIKFGRKYHGDFVCDNRLRKLNIVDIPDAILFGNYRVLVKKMPFARSGHVVECWSFRTSQLTQAIMDFFMENSTAIVQIDKTSFGVWKENGVYFVFDSFKRGPAGQALPHAKSGSGCLQIHLNIESLCRIMFMNAVVVKTDGNFFLHGIHVKAIGTFSMNRGKEDAASFGTLHIKYPFECEKVTEHDTELQMEDCGEMTNYEPITCTLVQCLSELSVAPCERTCSERQFQQQQKKIAMQKILSRAPSIHSIAPEFRLPEYDNIDVIDAVVGEFLCNLMDKIRRKTDKTRKICVAASKVLLQSDKNHLKDLKLRLKRGEDYDNICAEFRTRPPVYKEMTLEQELALESNFQVLLDGQSAIYGTTNIDIENQPLKGILATISAAALSCKYKVSTWSSDVIEYIFESSSKLEERFWSYNHTLDLIFRKQIPKLQFGSTTYHIKVLSHETVVPEKLKEHLEGILLRVAKVIIICKGLSCLIMRRYNLFYMFMGCPCDLFGFRSKTNGPMCLLRVVDLDSIVRRIQSACGTCSKYVLIQIVVKDITDPRPDRFTMRTASQEEIIYGRELTEKERQKQRYRDKMRFIEHEIRKESERVKKFQQEKAGQPQKKGKGRLSLSCLPKTSSSQLGEEMEGFAETSAESVQFKHKPGKSFSNQEEDLDMDYEGVVMPQLGYQLKDQDILFKIQGSTALDGRTIELTNQIKACYFASTVALLYAILRPLNHWDSQRIDKVIAVARNIARKTADMNIAAERVIKNIEADEFTFDVKVQAFTPMGSFGGNLDYKITKTIKTDRYFIVQLSNMTFAVYHDDYFHLFDPYPSMELIEEHDEGEELVPPDFIPIYPEQNTASWVLFKDLKSMLLYVSKRTSNKNWKTEFQIHTIGIMSYKTAPKRIQLINLLTDELNTCQQATEKLNLCTHTEEIEWLDIYPHLVIWSRLNAVNAVQRQRGSPLTREKNYDIEIPDKLYSLWGSLHPNSTVFGESRGKQHLAINVVACCVANVYQVTEWNSQVLDNIVINGNDYYNDSVATINRQDYEISLEHLNTIFEMGQLHFEVHLESVTYGYLYAREKNELNLAAALTFFFTHHHYGIIQCMKRNLAIGKYEHGFFMFDCQTHGIPLFHTGQGAAYILRATHLQTLLYCIVMTLNLPYYNAQFMIHKVEMINEKVDERKSKSKKR